MVRKATEHSPSTLRMVMLHALSDLGLGTSRFYVGCEVNGRMERKWHLVKAPIGYREISREKQETTRLEWLNAIKLSGAAWTLSPTPPTLSNSAPSCGTPPSFGWDRERGLTEAHRGRGTGKPGKLLSPCSLVSAYLEISPLSNKKWKGQVAEHQVGGSDLSKTGSWLYHRFA